MDAPLVGQRFVRGEIPEIGTLAQRWAWAYAGSDACTIAELVAGDVVIFIANRPGGGRWKLMMPVDRFLEEWRLFA